jgi:chromate transporter
MTLARMTAVFLRVGNTTFGGGDPTIAALQRELCERRNWLSHADYRLAYALARVTPGTNMLAFCAAAGWRLRGWAGAWLAVLAVTLPSSALVVLLTRGYQAYRENPPVMAAVNGTLAAAVGLMAAAALLLIRPFWHAGGRIRAVLIPAVAAALVLWAGWSPLQAIAAAALAGLAAGPSGERTP